MKKEKSGFLHTMMSLVIAAVYSLILFLVKKNFSIASWIAYGFTITAFFLMIVDHNTKRNVLFSIPRSCVTMGYCVLQFFIGGVLLMCFDGLNPVGVLIGETLLLAVYLLLAFGLLGAESVVEAQDDYAETKIQTIRMMQADLQVISCGTQDEELKKEILALMERIKYSDPFSHEMLQDLEERIKSNISLLREEIEDNDIEKAHKRVKKIQQLIEERNAKCAVTKKRS